ncbi:Fc receptor-like B, partial [Centropristis striata]|uniref:Fc receptor-like B n=1 Tax=Centropristis striata TaxID=184440 RepID=UPI0027E19D36
CIVQFEVIYLTVIYSHSIFSSSVDVLILLVAQIHQSCAQKHDAARIVPSRLQLFEYESVSFKCESLNGSAGWEVVRIVNGEFTTCADKWRKSSGSLCAVRHAYQSDSGEYWCQTGGGGSSNRVNISVTAGPVVLESPAVPVVEGDQVTLSCRTQTTSSNRTDFYKDGLLFISSSTGNTTIHRVSKSDEGLYKCSISDGGESPESWITVKGEIFVCLFVCFLPQQDKILYTLKIVLGTPHHTLHRDNSCHLHFLMRTVFTAVMVAMMLLLLGLLHCWTPRGT